MRKWRRRCGRLQEGTTGSASGGPRAHGPQIATVTPAICRFTNSVCPSGLNTAPANSLPAKAGAMFCANGKMSPRGVRPRRNVTPPSASSQRINEPRGVSDRLSGIRENSDDGDSKISVSSPPHDAPPTTRRLRTAAGRYCHTWPIPRSPPVVEVKKRLPLPNHAPSSRRKRAPPRARPCSKTAAGFASAARGSGSAMSTHVTGSFAPTVCPRIASKAGAPAMPSICRRPPPARSNARLSTHRYSPARS